MTENNTLDVVELRVHGVHGTTPEVMLGDPEPLRVAGDDMARFFRRRRLLATPPSGGRPRRWRDVEAFHWGRFTSGSPSRALWLALAPFALLNLSRYALLLPEKRNRRARFADAVLRLLGLVLTLMLVTNVAYVSIELVMHQCASSIVCRQDNSWLDSVTSRQFGPRLLLGAAPPLAVVLLFWWFGRQSFLYEPRGELTKWTTPNGSFDDRAFWHTSPKAPILRAMHVAAACAVLGLLFAAFLYPVWKDDKAYLGLWLGSGLLLILVVLVIIAWGPEPENLKPDPKGRDAVKLPLYVTAIRWLCALHLLVSITVTAVKLWPAGAIGPEPLAGFEIVPNVEAVLAMGLLLVLLVACVLLRFSRHSKHLRDAEVPVAFRPLWNGYGTWVIAAVATLLAAGFSGGLAFRVADLVGNPVPSRGDLPDTAETCGCHDVEWPIQLGASYWTGAWLWGVLAIALLLFLLPLAAAMTRQRWATCLFLAGAVFGSAALTVFWTLGAGPNVLVLATLSGVLSIAGGVTWWLGWSRNGLAELAEADYASEKADPRVTRRVTTSWRLALTKYRYHWGLTLPAVGGGVVVGLAGIAALLRMTSVLDHVLSPELGNIGAWVLAALLSALLLLGIRSWQGTKLRTAVGVLWDLLAFWPRLVHPICPPPYGGRAVLETAHRTEYLAGHGAKAVVLSGHSQGSVVCVAAISVLRDPAAPPEGPDPSLAKVGLVSYGSQLQWAYSRIFPAYLGYRRIEQTLKDLGKRWVNVYRWTDPLGGPVLTWPPGETPWPGKATPPADDPLPEGVTPWSRFPLATAPPAGEREAADTAEPAGAHRLGNDFRLRDPEFTADRDDRPKSPLRGHGAYYDDPVFDVVVADLADVVRGEESPR
ncbi:hypothetical protein AMES_4683 [Amycolatopsis mediterranei S699]|uniref:Integral membrane protein n=2 Tax=Amycolatopsis mediterranei TaxID=33910 RepID=A0A0H3D8W1_AMYMU|nr:hypothetical protein [Amycolatopsis mediterranei]ADJ46508.1 conserved hypothetical protein [Amycolatopsis mediterranei U32]AEK43308.1 hypothetical protein RAM_24140 [Amycolatopsis mediterranei S699]AFO78219.1 hypothetical protein AMES_4683 [Amycolatopsis mediterranei S699]AGT85347.1 hypothetical protein B737_4683 [Amycolatopsis mediterranei RB]KDO06399.1 hypothetical protein DV26_33550 [Amycolatopsis mediterranei]